MDNLRVITVLGAFGGGVQGGNSGGSDTPVGTVDLACTTHICNGKRYVLSASKLMCDKGCTSFSFCDSGIQVACGAQAEIWIDNTGDRVDLQWPADWLWPSSDGITYEYAGAGEEDTHAAETKC